MDGPNIRVHIERLVLDGLPIERRHGPHVQAALEAELSRLLTENGLTASLQAGGALPGMRANAIQLAPGSSPAQIGQSVAQSVYDSIGQIR
jgi:hypothetical protein